MIEPLLVDDPAVVLATDFGCYVEWVVPAGVEFCDLDGSQWSLVAVKCLPEPGSRLPDGCLLGVGGCGLLPVRAVVRWWLTST